MFLDHNYLLSGHSARVIYRAIEKLPVIDPHNHADVAALAANRPYTDLWQLFGATDHYVWETMRKRSIPEELITGKADPKAKFTALCRVMPRLAGNPVYEWLHLDLRILGIELLMNEANAEKIWAKGCELLQKEENLPLNLLRRMNVEVICSTDDPADLLDNHDEVNRLAGRIQVRPTWRPDKAMKIAAPDYPAYLSKLEARFGHAINTLEDLLAALEESHAYFAGHGCRASDHGLEYSVGGGNYDDAAATFLKMRKGESLSRPEIDNFMALLLEECAAMNAETGWVTQLHVGPVRDVRDTLFRNLGVDVGGDVCNCHQDNFTGLVKFLNRFDGNLKVVLYCLDPVYQPMLASLSRAFGDKVALGSAWWLCDTPIGMRRQLEYIGSVDVLSCFAGMVSDSRKLLSYSSRFEMFRRTLADVLGKMVELGQMPEDVAVDLARYMAYDRVREFWNL